jgi:hypothetical protein
VLNDADGIEPLTCAMERSPAGRRTNSKKT